MFLLNVGHASIFCPSTQEYPPLHVHNDTDRLNVPSHTHTHTHTHRDGDTHTHTDGDTHTIHTHQYTHTHTIYHRGGAN